MFLNDEWITGNQIHQLDTHHQLLYSEGKYGYYENGTPGAYFREKNEILQYSSYLPIISYPFLMVIKWCGESCRYLLISIWSLLLIFLSIIIKNYDQKRRGSNLISKFLLIFSIFSFYINIYYYSPLSLHNNSSPYELLGVWLYHICLLILLSITIYFINKNIFIRNPTFVVIASISCITCSSYLFWMTTLKDHIDSVFFSSLIIFFIVQYQRTRDQWYFPVLFMLTGILIWIRIELGIFILGFLLIFFIYSLFTQRKLLSKNNMLFILISPIFSFIGTIPYLIGNYFITGNPVTLAWQIQKVSTTGDIINPINTTIPNETSITTIIQTFIFRITPHFHTFFIDIFNIIVNPVTLKIPILSLTPILFCTIMLIPHFCFNTNKKLTKNEKEIILILFLFTITIILAYASSLSSLDESKGIYPDFRYLCPIYLPLNLIGLIFMNKIFNNKKTVEKILNLFCINTVIGTIGVIVILTYFHQTMTFWDIMQSLNFYTSIIVYCIVALFVVVTYAKFEKFKENFRIVFFTTLIVIPLLWQLSILIICNYYADTFVSYPPMLPIVQTLFSYLSGN
jgi:hypothetical protein